MKYKKNKQSIIIFFLIIIMITSFTYFLNENRKYYGIERMIRDISINIYSVFSKSITPKNEITFEKSLNNNMKNEINSLKKVLELNHELSGFDYVNATILSRNVSYWLNNIVIDKGTKDGIKKDNAVVTPNGLIGKITKVNKNTSIVKLLTSSTYKVSVKVGNKYGILEKYNSKNKMFIIEKLDSNTLVKKNDEVITSGLGGIFPSGILIGKVKKIEDINFGTSKRLYVEPIEDFNNIRYVTILENNND